MMRIAFFGSSLVSAYWNGAATYWRGIVSALAARGHDITFYEPDAYDRQQHRDIDDPDYAKVHVYSATAPADVRQAVALAADAHLVIKCSGVGVYDELLESEMLSLQSGRCAAVFWDVDAPATLERLDGNPRDPFIRLIPRYDAIFTYGGGSPVVDAYLARGARSCNPIYNAVNPQTHHHVAPEPRFAADLGFMGNRLPDRESRVDGFFFDAARAAPDLRFLLGGSGWQQKDAVRELSNVNYVGHVYTRDHNAFCCTPKAVLNISRDSMARLGFSPATRVFEAAGAGACIITDRWCGIEQFLEPGEEILVADDARDVITLLRDLTPATAREIGMAARRRVLRSHTYDHRGEELERVLSRIMQPLSFAL